MASISDEQLLSKPPGLDGKLEIEAKNITTRIADAAFVSIAVSLKRIADALDGGDGSHQGIRDTLFFLEQKARGQ
jgi:hypothetical protein